MRTWTVIGISSAHLFLLLAAAVRFAPDAVNIVDNLFASWLLPLQTYSWVGFFLAVTALGSTVGVISIGIGFAYLAHLSNAQVLRLTFLLTAVALLNRTVKEFFARARPEPLAWFDLLPSFSFPSAHASAVMALYGFIAVYLYRRTRRFVYAFLPLLAILLVGLSRVALNVHHASDVIGGYLLGLVLLACAITFPFERSAK